MPPIADLASGSVAYRWSPSLSSLDDSTIELASCTPISSLPDGKVMLEPTCHMGITIVATSISEELASFDD
jgi:hypothetical protein